MAAVASAARRPPARPRWPAEREHCGGRARSRAVIRRGSLPRRPPTAIAAAAAAAGAGGAPTSPASSPTAGDRDQLRRGDLVRQRRRPDPPPSTDQRRRRSPSRTLRSASRAARSPAPGGRSWSRRSPSAGAGRRSARSSPVTDRGELRLPAAAAPRWSPTRPVRNPMPLADDAGPGAGRGRRRQRRGHGADQLGLARQRQPRHARARRRRTASPRRSTSSSTWSASRAARRCATEILGSGNPIGRRPGLHAGAVAGDLFLRPGLGLRAELPQHRQRQRERRRLAGGAELLRPAEERPGVRAARGRPGPDPRHVRRRRQRRAAADRRPTTSSPPTATAAARRRPTPRR